MTRHSSNQHGKNNSIQCSQCAFGQSGLVENSFILSSIFKFLAALYGFYQFSLAYSAGVRLVYWATNSSFYQWFATKPVALQHSLCWPLLDKLAATLEPVRRIAKKLLEHSYSRKRLFFLHPGMGLWLVAGYGIIDWLVRTGGRLLPTGLVESDNPSLVMAVKQQAASPWTSMLGFWDEALLLTIMTLWFIHWLTKDQSNSHLLNKEYPSTITIFVVLLLYAGLQVLLFLNNSPNLGVGIDGLRVAVQHTLWFFPVALLMRDARHWQRLLTVLVFILTAIAAVGDYQYFVKAPIPSNWIDQAEAGAVATRAYSLVGSPNILGSLMVLGIPVSLGLAYGSSHWRPRLIYASAGLIMTACLIFTLSRGAWLALSGGMLLFFLLRDRRVLACLTLGAFILPLVLPIVSPGIAKRIDYMLSPQYIVSSAKGGRIDRWEKAMEKAASAPLTGVGLGRYGGAAAERNKIPGTQYTDSYYMKVLAETGVLGLGAFLLLMAFALRHAVSSALTAAHPYWRSVGAGLTAGIFGIILHNLVENVFEVPMMAAYFWMAVAMAGFVGLYSREEGA